MSPCLYPGAYKLSLVLDIIVMLYQSFSPYLIVSQTCGHPFQDVDNDSVIIEDYMDPAFEGAVLSFDCPPQHVLIGPNTTICMGNGEWEPDPREVECKGTKLHCANYQLHS